MRDSRNLRARRVRARPFHSADPDAVNVALATLTATAATAGSGTISISVTRVGDLSASKATTIDLTAQIPQLVRPARRPSP